MTGFVIAAGVVYLILEFIFAPLERREEKHDERPDAGPE